MEISFTQFRVYLECPWQYKLRFVDRRAVPPTPGGSLGLSIHKALECYHRSCEEDLETLLDCYKRLWVDEGLSNPEEEKRLFAKGRRLLEKYHRDDGTRRAALEGVEREFCYLLERHSVRGKIDRLDHRPEGGVEIIDYKALMEPLSASEVANNLQLRFYALGVRESLGLDPVSVAIYFLSAGALVSAAYDSAGEAELKALIVQTADRIEAGDFKADTNFCPRCPYRRDCVFSTCR